MNDSSASRSQQASLSHAMQVADVIRKHMLLAQVPVTETTATTATTTTTNAEATTDQSFRFPVPPGVVEGVTACIIAGVALLPVRRVALQLAGKQLHMLADLIVSTGQAMVAANVGLYTGCVYGSREYLRQLASVPPQAHSPTASAVCREIWLQRQPPPSTMESSASASSAVTTAESLSWNSSSDNSDGLLSSGPLSFDTTSSSSSSWDPRVQTIQALANALEHCRQRQQYEESTKVQRYL